MARKTARFGLQVLEGGNDDVSIDGFQFTAADRDFLDAILAWLAEEHRHTGQEATETVLDAPELTLDTTTGGILGGERVRYRYSLVDENGLETAASAEAFIDTPEPVESPAAPGLDTEDTGGTHIPGVYFYVLSAYQDATTNETLADAPNQIQVPVGSTTNQNVLDLPSLPDGATGFNVYRRGPGSTKYFFLDSIDMEVATPPTEYVDDNSVAEDCDRGLPVTNTTYSTNSVLVSLPGVDPEVPEGYTWRVYRTYIADDWGSSLLHWVVEETEEDSGIIVPEHTDLGDGTEVGAPPDTGRSHGTPPKITLTDVVEVKGILPVSRNVIPFEKTFAQAGPVIEGEGEFVWVCPFDHMTILGVRANLGRSSTPDADDVIVDVNKFDSTLATPAWDTIFTTQAFRPRVPVGSFIGDIAGPDVTDLVAGDAISVDIDQAGGGANTDEDLVVTIYGLVQSEVDSDITIDLSGLFTNPDS